MQKEFEEASFTLKPGEVSRVIETASGLHLIERYVCDIRSQVRQGSRLHSANYLGSLPQTVILCDPLMQRAITSLYADWLC